MKNIFDDQEKLEELLAHLYQAQKEIVFQELVMQVFMEKVKITEEESIALIKKMIDLKWLIISGCIPKYFLRPGYIGSFPVVISQKGLELLTEKGLREEVEIIL